MITGDWTKNEDDYLVQAWPNYSASEIGAFLERSRSSVLGRARRLGIRKLSQPSIRPYGETNAE